MTEIRFQVRHRTRYRYSLPVTVCQNEAHLAPRQTPRQRCEEHVFEVKPHPSVSAGRIDYFGNPVAYFAVQEPHEELDVTANSVVSLSPLPPVEGPAAEITWEAAREQFHRDPDLITEREFLLDSPFVSSDGELRSFAETSFSPGRPLAEAVRDLARRIQAEFKYDPHFTTIATPLAQVLKHRRGVCQDFAHLAIGGLRSLGIPARYVSGYLETIPAEGPRLQGADASHAWAAAYIPHYGWLDVDPTNAATPLDSHITVSWGRDYSDVTPLKGVITGGGRPELTVEVDVERCTSAAAG
jgi:transglutaminase-like putative cysteine protease